MPNSSFAKPNTCPKSLRLSLFFLLFPLFFYGQSLTGLWTGALHNDSSTVRKDQLFEIALTEYNGKVYGYSRSEFIVNDTLYYIVKRVKGTIDGDVCEVMDDEIVSYSFRGRLDKGIKVTSTFRRNQNDSTWYLDGTWKTNATKKYYSITGKVSLAEEKDLAVSKLFPHLEELNLANEVAFYKERTEAPPVVKVAKPEKTVTSYTVRPDIGTSQTEAIAVSAKPAPAITAIQPTNEVQEDLPSVKRSNDDIAKTDVNGIPVSNDQVVPSSTSPAFAVVKKNTPATPAIDIPVSSVTPPPATEVATKTAINKTTPAPDELVIASNTKQPVTTSPQNNSPANNIPASVTENKQAKIATVAKIDLPQVTNQPTSIPVAKNTVKAPDPVNTKKTNEKPAEVVKQNPTTLSASQPASSTVAKNVAKPVDPTVTPKKDNDMNTGVVKTEPVKITTPAVSTAPQKSLRDITEKAAVVAGRKSEFSQVVNFKSDSLVISLYDNGEIDGDTVSVFMNGEPLLLKQGLRSNAIKKTIYITPGQDEDFTLVMFAESLGKYPPNTGLLVIRDGNDVYNLRFSSDFEKNAGIVFRKKK